jgi:hypothetical protein
MGNVMIDWVNVGFNALWIIASALALATLSYASWKASIEKEKLRAVLKKPAYTACLDTAGLLFCAGLAGTSGSTLEIILWSVLGVLFAVQIVLLALGKGQRAQSKAG